MLGKYEVDEEKWTEWNYDQIKVAREKAAKFLSIRDTRTTPNSLLCEKLGLTVDMFRPQRLIQWAEGQP